MKTGALQVSQDVVVVTERGHRTVGFLTSMLDPFLQGYQVRERDTLYSCPQVLGVLMSSRLSYWYVHPGLKLPKATFKLVLTFYLDL